MEEQNYRNKNGTFIKGAVLPESIRNKMSKSHLGIKRPLVGIKIGLALKGKKKSESHRLNMRKANLGKKHSIESRKKMSLSRIGKRTGDKCNFWKGGITPIHTSIRTSLQYKLWRKAIFERDDYTCVWCGAKSSKGNSVMLNADHIKPFAEYPDLRFVLDNGRTLCEPCHKKTDTYAKHAIKKIKLDYEKPTNKTKKSTTSKVRGGKIHTRRGGKTSKENKS